MKTQYISDSSMTFQFKIHKQEKLTDWQISLIQKTDFLSVVGTINILITLLILSLIRFYALNIHLGVVLGAAILQFIINRIGCWRLSIYLFFSIGIYILSMATYCMGLESNALLFFFPLTLSIVQILGRKETFTHLVVWLILYFITIATLVCFTSPFSQLGFSASTLNKIQIFNILLSFLSGLMLIGIVTRTAILQENNIRKTIGEKELLLAELFHRVKNNLNLVTSLLNIRKDKSQNQEVIDVLEECRNRVFSMALVHQQTYSGVQVGNLNLSNYLSELIKGIEQSFDEEAVVNIEIHENKELPISKAIPTGLILNELLTNVYKHAKVQNQLLKIQITVNHKDEKLSITVVDNGPGISNNNSGTDHLGLELIKSLSEQIDGIFEINNRIDGQGTQAKLVFHLK